MLKCIGFYFFHAAIRGFHLLWCCQFRFPLFSSGSAFPHTKLQMNKWTLNLQQCNGIKRMKSGIRLLHVWAPPISCQERFPSSRRSEDNKSSHSFIKHFSAFSADVFVYLLSLGQFQSYQAETGTKSCSSPHSALIPAPALVRLVPVFTSERRVVYTAQSFPKVLKTILMLLKMVGLPVVCK